MGASLVHAYQVCGYIEKDSEECVYKRTKTSSPHMKDEDNEQ